MLARIISFESITDPGSRKCYYTEGTLCDFPWPRRAGVARLAWSPDHWSRASASHLLQRKERGS